MHHGMYNSSTPYRQQYTVLDKSRYCQVAILLRHLATCIFGSEVII